MEFKFVLGVDISKGWFNYCLMSEDFEIVKEGEVENRPDAISLFISELFVAEGLADMGGTALVMEHTGLYVRHLADGWLGAGGRLSIVPAMKVSRLLGGQSGWDEKSDVIDARRLAEYGFRYSDMLTPWKLPDDAIRILNALNATRKRLLNALNMLKVPLGESRLFDGAEVAEAIGEGCGRAIAALGDDLKRVEEKIRNLVRNDGRLGKLFDLITSVEGVGPVTATEVIIATEGFEKFRPDQAKAFARYSGVAPLKKQSGKVSRRNRTGKRANRKIKTVLTMGATSLIGTKSMLGQYYERRIGEGKPHFSVVNAMRNKIILRIFAVVRNQVTYDKNLNFIN